MCHEPQQEEYRLRTPAWKRSCWRRRHRTKSGISCSDWESSVWKWLARAKLFRHKV